MQIKRSPSSGRPDSYRVSVVFPRIGERFLARSPPYRAFPERIGGKIIAGAEAFRVRDCEETSGAARKLRPGARGRCVNGWEKFVYSDAAGGKKSGGGGVGSGNLLSV